MNTARGDCMPDVQPPLVLVATLRVLASTALRSPSFGPALAVAAVTGAGAAMLGVFIVLRKMSLVGDALSHIALPGMALAILFHVNPFFGAFAFLALAVVAIVAIERGGLLSVDALTGVFFTTGLALGALMLRSSEALFESLFGDITRLGALDAWIATALGGGVLAITLWLFQDFAAVTLSPELAESEGIAVARHELVLLLLLALLVAIGIRVVGVLLVGALVIIPACSAKNVCRSLRTMAAASVLFGLVSVMVGLPLGLGLKLPPGPVIVLVSAAIFFLSLLLRRA